MSRGLKNLDPKDVAEALRKNFGLVSAAAKSIRCTPQAIYQQIKKHSEVADAAENAENAMLDIAEGSLFTAIQEGKPWAIKFYLETKGRRRGYVSRHEISGPGGRPVRYTLNFPK